jgi:orotate phosphoribosyltransferase
MQTNQVSLNKIELAKMIYDSCHLTGHFKLRSGKESTEYFDKYRLESDPQILKLITAHSKLIVPKDCTVLAGLELGGVPLATALSLETGLPVCFVRKEAKTYGTCQLAEGIDIKGKKLLLVEDVITSGGQVIESAQELRALGAIVENVICVINRGGREALDKLKRSNLDLQSLFVREDFPS